jgi:hypothetical protein
MFYQNWELGEKVAGDVEIKHYPIGACLRNLNIAFSE